ncbi:MAG: hypothetical protein JWL87_114 [Candidatus Adlerbacteria bacterium]|nr:hypothetical protein [Candidatus Adlerbacteria bacterium]
MTTLVAPLTGESLETIQSLARNVFLDGECYAFAIGLSRGLGWSMVGLMEGPVIRHALAYNPKKPSGLGVLYDVRGKLALNEPELGNPFHHRPPYILREVTEDDLRAVRPVHERSIAMAGRMAEAMWPHLPWKQGLAVRAKAFADALAALSREHGFWIRSPYDTMRPILSEAHGDERGYTIRILDDGMAYTIDRRLTDA